MLTLSLLLKDRKRLFPLVMKLSGFQWLVQGAYEVIYDDSKKQNQLVPSTDEMIV